AGAGGEHGLLAQIAALGHGLHHRVAVRARDRARLVRAAPPGEPRSFFVALEANRIALSDRRFRLLAERDQSAIVRAARLRVLLSGTVTAFAAELLDFGA